MSVFRMSVSSTKENTDKKVWLDFPTTADTFKRALKTLGLPENAEPQDYRLSDFESYKIYYEPIGKIIGSGANINEVNFLAQSVNELNTLENYTFQMAVISGEHTKNTADLINLALNMECYEIVEEIYDYEDAGRYLMEQQTLDRRTLNFLEDYIDYKKFGKEYSAEHRCHLLDNDTFLDGDKNPFYMEYDGNTLNVPIVSRITAIETEPGYYDEKFDFSKQLAYDLDRYFRNFDRKYAQNNKDETAAQILLSDNIMNGKTDFIHKELIDLKINPDDDLIKSLAKFESRYAQPHKKPSIRLQLKYNQKEQGDKSIPKPPHKSPPEL